MTGAPAKDLRPTVKWAQRDDSVWLTIEVKDPKDVKVDLLKDSLNFSANSSDGKHYAFSIELNAAVSVEESKHSVKRSVEIYLKKETKESWNTPMKGQKNWFAVDWTKWADSDDEDEKPEFDHGGMGGMGDMGGMGGMGGMNDFDMSSLMKQMGGAGGEGLGGMMPGMDEDSDDDEDAAEDQLRAGVTDSAKQTFDPPARGAQE